LQNASLDATPVGFELGFARASCADAAAELGHGFAAAGESRQHVFKLRELDLQLAFAGAGVTGKDIEDELGAIDHSARQRIFEVAKLGWAEVVIDDGDTGLRGGSDRRQLLHFSAAYEGCGVSFGAMLDHLRGDGGGGA